MLNALVHQKMMILALVVRRGVSLQEHKADLAKELCGEGENGVRKRSPTEDVPILGVSLPSE